MATPQTDPQWFNPDPRRYGSLLAMSRTPAEFSFLPQAGRVERQAAGHIVAAWDAELHDIPSLFRRLVYLAGLRRSSGRYEHFGLSLFLGSEKTDQHLSLRHDQLFAAWLRLSLRDQKEDLGRYFSELALPVRRILPLWEEMPVHRWVLPDRIPGEALSLYGSDFELVLSLFRAELAPAAASAPAALKACASPA